jgi:hypothetical protein
MISNFFEELSFEDSILMAFNIAPSDLSSFYWTKSLEDLQRITGLRVRLEMVKAMSITESFMYTAAQIFGKKEEPAQDAGTASEMMAMADLINGV